MPNINKKKIIVDVDSTLWDFCYYFHKELSAINKDIPNWDTWKWDTPFKYVEAKYVLKAIDYLHKAQESFSPFKDARTFLNDLSNNYHIIIASHRKPEYKIYLEKWLYKNKLKHDEVHTIVNKKKLFSDKDIVAIVDDCPDTLDAALEGGVLPIGIKYSWNKHCNQAVLLKDLTEINKYLKEKSSEMSKV